MVCNNYYMSWLLLSNSPSLSSPNPRSLSSKLRKSSTATVVLSIIFWTIINIVCKCPDRDRTYMRDRLLDHLDIVLVEFLPRLTLQNCFQIRKLHFPLHCRAGWQEGLYNGFLVFVAGLFLSAIEWKLLFSEDKPWLVSQLCCTTFLEIVWTDQNWFPPPYLPSPQYPSPSESIPELSWPFRVPVLE